MKGKTKAMTWISIISYDTKYLIKRMDSLFKSNIFADC